MKYFTLLAALWAAILAPVVTAQEKDEEQDSLFRELLEEEARALAIQGTPGRAVTDLNVHELIDTVMMVRLSKELELTDEQTVLLVRRFGKNKEELLILKGKRYDMLGKLRYALEENADEVAIRSKLDALLELDDAIATLTRKMIDEAGKELTVRQKAKLYVFIGDFENDMRKLIQRAKMISMERRRSPLRHEAPVSAERSHDDHREPNPDDGF